jgi:hypothetical protein
LYSSKVKLVSNIIVFALVLIVSSIIQYEVHGQASGQGDLGSSTIEEELESAREK